MQTFEQSSEKIKICHDRDSILGPLDHEADIYPMSYRGIVQNKILE
jgi:hypothetical protein